MSGQFEDDGDKIRELLAALTAERYRSPWWRTPADHHPASAPDALTDWDDSEATCARRRRAMAADFEQEKRAAS
ncbi:hypothetical protein FB382_004367 [Nocardioides ginsengisegetis]|uniref:Uncharacterized protein n=1 Tax=Nocardioides ginsengisegetis TaxID=661491 RepID=A0A7W3J481_9ACTN|nr:hypothetical protein [Nocardioides ginsengisegetis]MBA8805592.1 hypothetical protein [Nocardioides ginsengisegetis]MBA8806016.1 hypothetical protein [Nocardioides ginsengisegetis]